MLNTFIYFSFNKVLHKTSKDLVNSRIQLKRAECVKGENH